MAGKRGNTRQRIMEEAMRLFSINGFDAVSIRAIAATVGVGNSALYKHFSSKQEILDAIVEYSKAYFQEKGCQQMSGIKSLEDMKKSCMNMFQFQTGDEWIVMFRHLLMTEQFKNPQMAEIYQNFFIELPIESQAKLFEELMRLGAMKKGDARMMAMELYAPFHLYHTVGEKSDKVHELLMGHVENFYNLYVIQN